MGKWAGLKEKFARAELEPDYQALVDREKGLYSKLEVGALAEAYKEVKNQKWILDRQEKDLNLRLEALAQLCLERFEAMEIDSVRLASGGAVGERVKPYPKVTDQAGFLAWLKKNEPDERLQYPFGSLERLVRERLEAGKAVPPGVEVTYKNTVVLTGGRKNGEEAGDEDREDGAAAGRARRGAGAGVGDRG